MTGGGGWPGGGSAGGPGWGPPGPSGSGQSHPAQSSPGSGSGGSAWGSAPGPSDPGAGGSFASAAAVGRPNLPGSHVVQGPSGGRVRGSWSTAPAVVRIAVIAFVAAGLWTLGAAIYLLLLISDFTEDTVDPLVSLDYTGTAGDVADSVVTNVMIVSCVLFVIWAAGYLLFSWLSLRGYPAARIVATVLAVLSLFLLVGPLYVWPGIVLGIIATVLIWLPSAGNHFAGRSWAAEQQFMPPPAGGPPGWH